MNEYQYLVGMREHIRIVHPAPSYFKLLGLCIRHEFAKEKRANG